MSITAEFIQDAQLRNNGQNSPLFENYFHSKKVIRFEALKRFFFYSSILLTYLTIKKIHTQRLVYSIACFSSLCGYLLFNDLAKKNFNQFKEKLGLEKDEDVHNKLIFYRGFPYERKVDIYEKKEL